MPCISTEFLQSKSDLAEELDDVSDRVLINGEPLGIFIFKFPLDLCEEEYKFYWNLNNLLYDGIEHIA